MSNSHLILLLKSLCHGAMHSYKEQNDNIIQIFKFGQVICINMDQYYYSQTCIVEL